MSLGPTELLVLLVVLLGILLAVRLRARPAKGAGPSAAALRTPVPAELQSRIRTLAAADQRITAIKLLREATGLSLLDAKNAVDAIAAGSALPVAAPPLADRARSLLSAGREEEAVRLVAAETGMSAPEATTFIRALLP
jgi:hypothetical protein